jgi:single-stranded-DNA-specific exonuclease
VLGFCRDLLDSYGGHAFAAGLTVARDRLLELRERFEGLVRERLSPEDCIPRLLIDAPLRFSECGLEMVEWLERMSPHGLGNPEPTFVASGVSVESAAAVGGGKHLRMSVRDDSGAAQAIGFGFGDQAALLAGARRCDLAFVPIRNEWMGETTVQLRVKGVRVT